MQMNNSRTTWGPLYNRAPTKVVSIPVHFVGSERTRTNSATNIQRVARGFLVRKSVKKMLKMKVELEEIEINVNGEETLKLLKKDQKERLRIGETIMNLLLKLDCVRVFQCYALREFRKSLIKRVIFLQEFVDQIQMVGPTYEDDIVKGNFVGVEEKEDVGCEEEQEGGVKIESLMNCLVNENEDEGDGEEHDGDEKMDVLVKEENKGGNKIEALMNEDKCVNEEENCLIKEMGENGENEEDEEGNKMEGLEKMEESVGTSLVEEGIEGDSMVVKEEEGKIVIGYEEEDFKEGGDGNREMLKRMMEDNEKMMEMMAQLFERNEKQTTLLTSLTQRVEQLERAFTCDKLRRKKRRNVDAKYRHNA